LNDLISTDLFEEELQIAQDNMRRDINTFIAEDLHLPWIRSLQANNDIDTLKEELLKLAQNTSHLDIGNYTFIDEWSMIFSEKYDITTANHCRNVLRLLFTFFLDSSFFYFLCDRFHKQPKQLLNQIDTIKLLHWMLLWSVREYPGTTRLLFERNLVQAFEHLLSVDLKKIAYFLPEFMLWNINDFLGDIDNRHLLKELVEGKHVRKTTACPFPFSKKMAHYFINAPRESGFDDAVWYGIIFGADGNDQLLVTFRNHFRSWKHDPKLIKTLLTFFTTAGKEASREEIPHLLGYLQHVWDENKQLTLKGWTLVSLQRRATLWYDDLNRRRYERVTLYQQSLSWKGANYRSLDLELEDQHYQIIQLTTNEALLKESLALKHCVSAYAAKCIYRGTSIWSLQQKKSDCITHLATIEINNRGEIVQVKGLLNANPTKKVKTIISMWAKQEKLAY
jgi:hypothetical protein